MNIRLATEGDIDRLIRMRWDFTYEDYPVQKADEGMFQHFTEECRAFLTRAIQSGRWYIWVAEIENRIVSHVYIELIEKVPRPGRVTHPFGYMTNVYTVPEHRGKRIGAGLLARIEEWSRQEKHEFILVWPSEAGVPFYERHGYKLSREAMELTLE